MEGDGSKKVSVLFDARVNHGGNNWKTHRMHAVMSVSQYDSLMNGPDERKKMVQIVLTALVLDKTKGKNATLCAPFRVEEIGDISLSLQLAIPPVTVPKEVLRAAHP